MTATQIIQLYVFILAGFVGFLVITRVPHLLHTPRNLWKTLAIPCRVVVSVLPCPLA